jgi:hypothetical protein
VTSTVVWSLLLVLGHAPAPDDGDDVLIDDEDDAGDLEGSGELTDDGDDDDATVPPPAPTAPPPATATAAAPTPDTTAKFDDKAGPPAPSEAAIERDTDVRFEDPPKTHRRGGNRPGTRQRFAAEFKMGPYLPAVDRNYDGPGLGPYATIFGRVDDTGLATRQPKPGIMPAGYFEWQFLYLAGPLGIGTQVAFFRDRANALLAEPRPGENLRSSADRTTFGMVPLALLLSYRFELLADRFRWVPIVPFAKAGVGYTFWWTRDGSGSISENSAGDKGRGGVPGFQLNVGGMLRLDFIEPNTAKKLDATTGINHTYVFGEYQVARYNNFGIGNSIALGADTWFAGLAIEF